MYLLSLTQKSKEEELAEEFDAILHGCSLDVSLPEFTHPPRKHVCFIIPPEIFHPTCLFVEQQNQVLTFAF